VFYTNRARNRKSYNPVPVERVLDAKAFLLITAGQEKIVGVQILVVHAVGLASGQRNDDGKHRGRDDDRRRYGVHNDDRQTNEEQSLRLGLSFLYTYSRRSDNKTRVD